MSQSTNKATIADHAAHLVTAAFILSGERRATPEAQARAKEFADFCTVELEKAGYLTKNIEVREHPPGTPNLIKNQGALTLIPHKDGTKLEVNMARCQELFKSTYPNAWL